MKMEKAEHYQELEWCPGAESNHRHEDFQSTALPLSYPGTGTVTAVGWRRSMTCHRQCPEAFLHFFNGAEPVWIQPDPARHPHPHHARMAQRMNRSSIWPDQYQRSVLSRKGGRHAGSLFRRLGNSFQHLCQGDPTAFSLKLKMSKRGPSGQNRLVRICLEGRA